MPGRSTICRLISLLLIATALSFACCRPPADSEGDPAGSDHVGDDDNDSADDDDDASPECDADLLPVVYVCGILVNGDAFSTQTMRFASNGYCLDRLYSYDWNPLDGYWNEWPRLLEFVDHVLAETGAEQVDLISHSLGAGVADVFLSRPERAAKVAHYIQIASLPCLEIPGGVPSLNLSSADDHVIGVCEVTAAENIVLQDIDHLQTATSPETFFEMYRFFNDGREPETTDVAPSDDIQLSGFAEVYFTNDPVADIEVRIFEIDPATGERGRPQPDAVFHTDARGHWGPFAAQPNAYYEFVCLDSLGDWPPLHYYREPFLRSNNKVYFRVFPPPDSPLGWLFQLLPRDDGVAAFSWMNVNQAVIHGRDTLTVNGIRLDTATLADPEYTTLDIVFGDWNFNGQSDEKLIGSLLPSRRFIKLFDLMVGTESPQPIHFNFNGRHLAIRNWKAHSEGISTVVFE
jgi:hypothetical protein